MLNPSSTVDLTSTMTPPATIDPSATTTTTTIKMEDLHVPYGSPAPSASSTTSSSPQPSTQSEGKQVKKRKSWGQVLPEPKTSLPPRKRAKTEDEKEQRRIERVKRNRLAAHNSRERKRQEYEVLQAEKDQLEADLVAARQTIARMNMELNAYRQKYSGDDISAATSDLGSFTTDTIDPSQTTSSSFPSPVSMTIDSLDSPRDSSCQPETPSFNEATPDFDQTRYPAEILCDLHDLGFPFSLQPNTSVDNEKSIESLFDFDQFPDTSVESTTGLVDGDVFLSSSLFGNPDSSFDPADLFDAKHFDLQTAFGATHVSDGALAEEN
ncbi:hypothetical protein DM02DRAFT_515441 [Periconia macrospinosa]|uniref:BZIP domain-containing protein n=1 Tax=Periconia macrospinosa TaxID=97972 RepID=A0A2V1E6J4_9PLEO|nr:hypothetical protein DM02DRAFT_515441 [Periconia macrospinosa]